MIRRIAYWWTWFWSSRTERELMAFWRGMQPADTIDVWGDDWGEEIAKIDRCRCNPPVHCCGLCGWVYGEGYPARQAKLTRASTR